MISKSFLQFLDEHEKKLDNFIREDYEQEEEVIEEEVVIPVKKVATRPVQRPQPKVQPKIIKETSVPFSFCTSCGQKLPMNVNGKFCPFCGKQTLMRTDQKTKTASKTNGISENVDYASSLLDDETPMEQSRLLEYLEKNPVKNPMMEVLKANRGVGQSNMLESTSHACDLLDETPDVGGVKLLEMPDFSKFMPKKEEPVQTIPNIPMAPSVDIGVDLATQAELAKLGLL